MPVTPDRRMFRLHDPWVDPDELGSPLAPVGALVSSTREQLWVGSLQEDIDVRLVLEEWDGQPLLPEAWDEEAKARLYLRGMLTVDMCSAGTAVSRLRLSGGVGDYEVRVYARYREAVVQMYADLLSQHRDRLSDDFQREKRKLEGVERYLVQLWRDWLVACSVARLGRRRGCPGRRGGAAGGAGGRPVLHLGTGFQLGAGRGVSGGLRGGLIRMGAEWNHGVDHQRYGGHQGKCEEGPDDPAPGGPEPDGRSRPAERGQPGGETRVLRGEPPLYFGEHALLVH